jgi:hypothetical protein
MSSGHTDPKLRRLRRALVAALTAAPCVWLAGGGLRPAPARAQGEPVIPVGDTDLGPCPGDPIAPGEVREGSFPGWLQGAYLMLPIEVPAGTTSVRVKYCWEDTVAGADHVIDLGLWDARPDDAAWSEAQFRGWGGSSHPDVAVTPQGFSSEAEYVAEPKGHVPGRTTRGFVPGPIPSGTWAAELGLGAVISQAEGDDDGLADWRVEIELSSDPGFDDDPYAPAPYDDAPAIDAPGWYAGDLHVHAEHSALGDATMTETFDYAFRSLAQGGAGLDFITLSDYVTRSGWDEIGHTQAAHPGKLVMRSAEIITYRGHANHHASARYVDHRAGPVYELAVDGSLTLLRATRTPAEMFAEIHEAGGVTQLNHITTCPSSDPYCLRTCRGCPWDYGDEETDYAAVDAMEIQSGSGLKYLLFTATAIAFWDATLALGHRIAAVGSSDSHQAGRTPDALASPIGLATTVVYAQALSEAAIADGIRAGHTYVKLFGNEGPDLRLEAEGDAGGVGIMGDAIPDPAATLTAIASNVPADGVPHVLKLMRDGVEIESVAVPAPGDTVEFRAEEPGRYRIQLEEAGEDDDRILALTSPVYVPETTAPGLGLAAAAALAGLRTAGGSPRRRRTQAGR